VELLTSVWSPIAPDLAVEVISPNDLYTEIETKVEDYLSANVGLIWIVDPQRSTVEVIRIGHATQLLRSNHDLSGECTVPGFRCVVNDLFPPRSGI